MYNNYCGIEQWLAHDAHNVKIEGSSPSPATILGVL